MTSCTRRSASWRCIGNIEKKLFQSRSVKERKTLLDPCESLSIRTQADLLKVDRSSLYYKPLVESEENLALMRRIDEILLEDPTLGVLGMQNELRDICFNFNEKRICLLMR